MASASLRILLTADAEVPVPPILYGGIERVIDLLVREFRNGGHEVGLAANRDSHSPATEFFPWPEDHSRGTRPAIRNSAALSRAVAKFQPSVVHSFSRLMWLVPLAADRRPRIMSYQREPNGRTIRMSDRLHRGRLHFTGCSDYISRTGQQRGGGEWTTIHNAASPTSYTFRASVPDDAPLVFLSRVEEIKGCHIAIDIARRTGRRLVIAGNHGQDGEAERYWRERILPEVGKNGIEYVGPVDDRQKNDLLGRAAAMIVPVQWDEPFGIVFAESLACGTPVISSPRGALPEIIENGSSGFLITSVEEGVDAVGRLGTISREACRRRFDGCFSAPVIAGKYLSLYRRLIDQHASSAH